MSFFVPTRFVWRFGGQQVTTTPGSPLSSCTECVEDPYLTLAPCFQVHLCGSFTRWVETVPMQIAEGQPGVFAVVVHLPPG